MSGNHPIVVIPTYNEIENIELMVQTVLNLPGDWHLLVVDDNSPDGTGNKVKEIQQQFSNRVFLMERQGKQGLGTAYIAGFQWALEKGYAYICEMDCDFSHDPNDLNKLLEACKSGADMSIGSRYVNNLINVVNWPMGRVLLSYFASFYVRLVTGMKIMDTTAGFVCYKREVLENIQLQEVRFKGYAFQIEMKFKATLLGYALKEIPIIFTDRTRGTSKMSGGIVKEALFGVIWLKLNSWVKKTPKVKP